MATIKQQTNDDWRAKRSQEQLANGGLPLNAEWRLRRLTGSRLSTSFFSVNELALTASVGIRPLGQVIGSSSFHIGWQNQQYMASREMTVLSEAHNRVRRLALAHLQQEAKTLGARGVLGVRLNLQSGMGGHSLLEVMASGTAVGWHDHSRPPSLPFLCALTGQEFSALHRVGYRPVGLALGCSVFYQIGSRQTQQATQGGLFNGAARINQELTDYTDALSRTRRRAIHRLEGDAECAKAAGVVGIEITKKLEVREVEFEYNEQKIKRSDLVVHCTALGTAIAPFTERVPPVFAVMPLGGA